MLRKVLIVEDDITFGKMLQGWFTRNGFEAILTTQVEQAKDLLLENTFCLVFTDIRLPDGDGIMLLSWIREQKDAVPVIVMTSYAEVQSAVSAMKLGAFDYLEKPINPSVLKNKIEQALNQEQPVKVVEEEKPFVSSGVVYGESIVAQEMYEHIRMVAPTRMSVIILGESGTGKEYAARLIHENSNRKQNKFIAVDCGILSRELAPSELFGHLKGSFTSAVADKKGVFEEATGGTVFLDEVGNLPYEVQIQLLRALQEKKIRPVGSAHDISIDVRILAATNEDLLQAVKEGRFREDLYHRLNEFSIEVPPLRERKEDIPLFAEYFLQEANQELGKNIQAFDTETVSILKKQRWSGNLRELRNVIRRAALFAKTDKIVPANLPVFAPIITEEEIKPLRSGDEKEQIEKALEKTNGNKTLAAQLLKIDRKTLYNKMHQYGLFK